jgi:hypothetical protein
VIANTMDKINVGISIFANESSNIWNNGINQNVAFLGMLLRKSPAIGKVWFLNGGSVGRLPPAMEFEGIDIPFLNPQEVTHEIDVLVEMGAILPLEWVRRIQARGAAIVCFGVGHNYNAVAEASAFPARQAGIHLTDPVLRVETWGLPQHNKTCTPMMKTLTRKRVVEMPHLWSPYFLETSIRAAEASGGRFGFDPMVSRSEKRGWRTAVFEPNIAVLKNCWIPMLVCEQAYRNKPDSISLMMVMNSFQMKEHPTFFRFASNLDLTKHNKASYEPRVQFAQIMAGHRMDAVVAHHWECGLNYAYYDTLFGGYPLIHNSEFLERAGVGIFYPGFSARRGGEKFIESWEQSPEFWEDYRRKAKDYLATLHPEHPENIRIFTERFMHVWNARQVGIQGGL